MPSCDKRYRVAVYNESDEINAVHTAVIGDEDVSRAFMAALHLCNVLESRWAGRSLAPQFTVTLDSGADDQPVLIFVITLALRDDFSEDEWPADHVEKMKAELRIEADAAGLAPVAWYVTVQTKRATTGND